MLTIIDRTSYNKAVRKRKENIKYIVIHFLGVANADNPDLYNGGYGGHYYVARDGQVYMAVNPSKGVVWHCGGKMQGENGGSFFGKCTNNNSIGIECGVNCDIKNPKDNSPNWYFTKNTEKSLALLVKYLMSEYNIPVTNVIRHFDVTGKYCPAPYVTNNKYKGCLTWDEFKDTLLTTDYFINNLYASLLLRESDEEGFKRYVKSVSTGDIDLNTLLCNFALSQEHIYLFLDLLYEKYLGREPSIEESATWCLAVTNSGLQPFDLVHAITHSKEYKNRVSV